MPEVAQLKARFSAEGVDSTVGGIRKVEGAVQHASGVVGKLGQTLTFAAGSLLGGGIASIARGIGGMASGALDFSANMANVNSILQLSDEQLSKFSDDVLRIANDPGITAGPAELASALYDVVSSGFAGNDALNIVTIGAKAATAGMTDTATAVRGVDAVLNAYSLSAADAGHVTDEMFQIVNDGVITFPELSANMGTTLATANALGIGFSELGAAYAILTLNGMNASAAETTIGAIMTSILNPTQALTDAMKLHGYESAYDAAQQVGLAGVLDVVNDASKGNLAVEQDMLGSKEAVNAATILQKNNTKDLRVETDKLNKSSDVMDKNGKKVGATQLALNKQMLSGRYGLQQIRKEAAIFAATIEKRLDPTINKLGVGISKVIDDLTKGDFGGALDALTQVVSIGIDVAVGAIHLAENAADDVATWLNDHFRLDDVTKTLNIDAKTGEVSWNTSVDWGALASDLGAIAFGEIAKWLGGGANIGDGTDIGSPSVLNMALTPDGHWDQNANWAVIAAKMLAEADTKLSDAIGISTTDAEVAKSRESGKTAGDKFATQVWAGFKTGVEGKSKDEGGEGPDHSLHGLKVAFFQVMNYDPFPSTHATIVDKWFQHVQGWAAGIHNATMRGFGILTAQSFTSAMGLAPKVEQAFALTVSLVENAPAPLYNWFRGIAGKTLSALTSSMGSLTAGSLTSAAGISDKIMLWLNTTADKVLSAPTRLINWLRNLPTTIMQAVGTLKIDLPLPDLPGWLKDPLSIFGAGSGINGLFQSAAGGGSGPVSAISNFILGIPGAVLAAVGTLKIDIPAPALPGWMKEFIGFSISTGKAVTGIAGKIKDIPGAVLAAVGQLVIDIPTPSLPDWLTDLSWITDKIDAFKALVDELAFWQAKAAGGAPGGEGTDAFAQNNIGKYFPDQNYSGIPVGVPPIPTQPVGIRVAPTYSIDPATPTLADQMATLLPGLFGGGSGSSALPATQPVKFLADDSDVQAKWSESMTWAGIWASQTPTPKFMADNTIAGMQYQGAMDYGTDWASRTFTGLFNGDNSQAGMQWEGAVSYGDDWASRIFTGLFNGDNSGAGMQYEGAMSYGYSWASQVFTASFSVDVSGLWYASAVADQVASHIAAVMPHSPAREGPLREPIRFDYIGENFAGVMSRIKGIAHGGASAVAGIGGRSRLSGAGGGVVHNHYYLDGAILGPAATRWIQDEIASGAAKPVNRAMTARQMAGARA